MDVTNDYPFSSNLSDVEQEMLQPHLNVIGLIHVLRN